MFDLFWFKYLFRDQKSGIKDQKSGLKDKKSGFNDQKSGFNDQKSLFLLKSTYVARFLIKIVFFIIFLSKFVSPWRFRLISATILDRKSR